MFFICRTTDQPHRLHKKTSFTIINELEPNNNSTNRSRSVSPSGRVSPFRGKGFRADSSKRFSRPVSCPESPRTNQMDMNTISSHDDSQILTKPSVHFNIIPPIPRKRTAIRVIEATTDDNDSRDSVGDVSYHDRDMESFEVLSNGQMRTGNFSRRGSIKSAKPSPAPRQHIQRSASNLNRVDVVDDDLLYRPSIVNPRSYHKGLLGVVSGGGGGGDGGRGGSAVMPSRIPRRKSSVSTPNISRNSSISSGRRDSRISNSSDRLSMRRDSSVSPRRRVGGHEFGGSMIDLGMPSPSMTPSRSMNRISKPTTLSPIVGTPNKDCDQEPSHYVISDGVNRKFGLDSPTKIPIRRSSSININGISRTSSRANSRETSPQKTSPTKSFTKIPQKIGSKNSSPSKGAKHANDVSNKSGSIKSIPSSVNKEMSSARKESAITREKSSVKKPPASAVKREPSTLKRQPSTLKREISQQKMKHESSMIDLGGKPAKASATRREPNATLAKNQSDSSLTKRLEKKNSFKQKRRTSSESDGLNEIDTANLSDKLTPLTKTDGISMATAAITSQPVQITTAVTDHLSKKNSSGQIVNNDNSNVNSDNISASIVSEQSTSGKVDVAADSASTTTATTVPSVIATEAAISSTPTATAETIGKSDVTTKQEHAKIGGDANSGNTNGTESMQSGNEAVLEKKPSTRTLGGKSETGSAALGTPIVPESIERELIGTPIETKVNVIDNTILSTVENEALLMKSDDTIEMQEHEASEIGNMAHGMANDNRSGENMEKDNGIANMDQSNGAKDDM